MLHGFSFALVVGIIVGTYSSIFIASPIVLFWQNWDSEESGGSRAQRSLGGDLAVSPAAARKSPSRASQLDFVPRRYSWRRRWPQ